MPVKVSQRIESSSLTVRVLILDDDADWSSTTRQLLEDVYGVKDVDVARSCSEADDVIAKHSYSVVIVDAFLTELLADEGDDLVRGDRWLLNNLDYLAPELAAVVTGYPHPLIPKEIKSRGVELITKATPAEDEFLAAVGQLVGKDSGSDVGQKVEEHEQSFDASLTPLESELRLLFREWAERLEQAGVGTLFIGGKNLSAKDLLREVEEDTEIGSHILLLFTRHLRAKLTGKYPG